MGDGGPRFILALNPPTPAAHRAYAVLTLAPEATHAALLDYPEHIASTLHDFITRRVAARA